MKKSSQFILVALLMNLRRNSRMIEMKRMN